MIPTGPAKIGKYEVLDVIGHGGMGIVYKAIDPIIGRSVAIKMITSGSKGDPDLLQRFYTEARSTGSLQHPNILTVYDVGDQDGDPYLVMEYLEGETLDSIIRSGLPLSLVYKLGIVIELCKGLNYAHQHGVTHRDIKAGNIMVLKDGSPKIVDFGIARIGDSGQTRTGQVIGSVSYMAPEQLRGDKVDSRADIFSLGVVLYQLLTYALPFQADSMAATMLQILQESPRPLSNYIDQYPLELDALVSRALAKDREQRYQTAADLGADLSRVRDALKNGLIEQHLHAAELLLSQQELVKAKEELLAALTLDSHHTRAMQLMQGMSQAFGSEPEPPGLSSIEAAETLSARIHDNPVACAADPQSSTVIAPAVSTTKLGLDAAVSGKEPSRRSEMPDVTRIFEGLPDGGHSEVQSKRQNVRLTFAASEDRLLTGKTVRLTCLPFRIGRVNSEMCIESDPGISLQHAVIDWDGSAFTIADLDSTNGTYLNGKRLRANTSEVLPFGALVRLGNYTVLTFSSDDVIELPSLIGQLIDTRYKLLKLIRNGSKTALYEASDSRLPQRVAVKILSPSLASYPGYSEQFNREAEIAARLHHPHICPILDYGVTSVPMYGGQMLTSNYLTMGLMEGGSLSDRLSSKRPVPLEQIVDWLDDVSDALEYAHAEGVIHSGLKTSSLIFDSKGKAYVTDFGMAFRQGDLKKRIFLGSPEFLAPEQWEGLELTPKVDQYSLAVLTYLSVTGGLPFEGQVDADQREKNFARGPIPAHEEAVRKGSTAPPRGISEVLRRALSMKPEDRYPSVRDFFVGFKHAVTSPVAQATGRPRAFISYQRDSSSGWAVLFARELEQKHDVFAFVDTQRLDSAVRFPTRLKKAIEECDVFICLLSAETLKSKWVQEEIRLAWENRKPMVPVFQEAFSQPDASEKLEPHIETLITYDGVHLLDRRNIHVDYTIAELAKIVKEATVRSRAD
jgi:serine/threonine protein kinase